MRLGKIKARNDLINIEWFEGYVIKLNKFEAVVETGSDWLNFLFSGKVCLFLGDGLYSCTKGLHAHTVLEVPVLDIVVMDFYQVKLFWSVGEAFGRDLVFTNFIYAFTSFEDVTCFNGVWNSFTKHDMYDFQPCPWRAIAESSAEFDHSSTSIPFGRRPRAIHSYLTSLVLIVQMTFCLAWSLRLGWRVNNNSCSFLAAIFSKVLISEYDNSVLMTGSWWDWQARWIRWQEKINTLANWNDRLQN